ncbi:MAG: tetratricopeptide repeat protein [Planctomycetes bacterium]|nr:tetratricopeptide repeat protein [Planctomycetota bacterium]
MKKLQGDLDGTLADQTRALEIDPGLPEAYAERATIHAERGDTAATAADLRQALAVAPRGWVHRPAVEAVLRQIEGAGEKPRKE